MANPNVQKVPKLLLQINEWQAQGRLDKAHGQTLSGLTLSYNASVLALADEIGSTPDDELLAKAVALSTSSASSTGGGAAAAASSSSSRLGGGGGARKGRPALNIGAVKDANATPEATRADEQESQADALLKAKRMRSLKRQSLPEKLPASVQDQMPQQ